MPMTVPVCKTDEMKDGEMRYVELMGFDLLVIRLGDEWLGVDEMCTKDVGKLSTGVLDRQARTVKCPGDGSTFNLDTGEPVVGPATFPLQKYNVWAEGDEVLLEFVY